MNTYLAQQYGIVNAARGYGEFWKDITFSGLAFSLLLERRPDGIHLREICSREGHEINWIPAEIAALMKAKANKLIEAEER